MPRKHHNLPESHLGDLNREIVRVRAEDCPALAQRNIAHVGVRSVRRPFKIVRTDLSGDFILGTLDGEGRMFLDGQWVQHRSGMMSLAPAHALHSFQPSTNSQWRYCWVRFQPRPPQFATGAAAPRIAPFHAAPLMNAIMGLDSEMQANGNIGAAVLWVDLIERYVSMFSEPWQREQRLHAVWLRVQRELDREWTVADLARLASMSEEHLRRLCQRSVGRSPLQQLTALRIQYASHLLASTDKKIDEIANEVGYINPFAFSNTFKRITGWRPSSYRARNVKEA